jgi:hypothetical protein
MYPIPDRIRAYAAMNMPLTHPTHHFIWARTRVQSVTVIERPPHQSEILVPRKQPIPQDTHVVLADVDEEQFYDVRLEGIGHDVAVGDPVSLISHAPLRRGTFMPRLLMNHATQAYHRAYSDIMDQVCQVHGTHLSALGHQYWLSVVAWATPWNKGVDIVDKCIQWYISPMTPLRLRCGISLLPPG